MRYLPMESVTNVDFEILQDYINNGSSKALDPDHKRMLDICVACYGLLRDFPQKNVCIRKLMALKNLPETTARRYVDFTRKTWGDYLSFSREFLETYFIEKLMHEISRPGASEAVRSKNLATLEKYIESRPDKQVDPHLTESNQIYIQVNLNNKTFTLPEKTLALLPVEVRQQILNAMNNGTIDDDGAVALLEN